MFCIEKCKHLEQWKCKYCFMSSCLFIAALWSPAGERANLLALLYVMVSCVFVTLPCGVMGQVWYLIVLIPDLCLLTYFHVVCFHYKICLKCTWHKKQTTFSGQKILKG